MKKQPGCGCLVALLVIAVVIATAVNLGVSWLVCAIADGFGHPLAFWPIAGCVLLAQLTLMALGSTFRRD